MSQGKPNEWNYKWINLVHPLYRETTLVLPSGKVMRGDIVYGGKVLEVQFRLKQSKLDAKQDYYSPNELVWLFRVEPSNYRWVSWYKQNKSWRGSKVISLPEGGKHLFQTNLRYSQTPEGYEEALRDFSIQCGEKSNIVNLDLRFYISDIIYDTVLRGFQTFLDCDGTIKSLRWENGKFIFERATVDDMFSSIGVEWNEDYRRLPNLGWSTKYNQWEKGFDYYKKGKKHHAQKRFAYPQTIEGYSLALNEYYEWLEQLGIKHTEAPHY